MDYTVITILYYDTFFLIYACWLLYIFKSTNVCFQFCIKLLLTLIEMRVRAFPFFTWVNKCSGWIKSIKSLKYSLKKRKISSLSDSNINENLSIGINKVQVQDLSLFGNAININVLLGQIWRWPGVKVS